MPSDIRVQDLCYRFGEKEILRNVQFGAPHGGRLVICGRSGSGKSTLLEICAGLLKPHEGTVYWNGWNLQDMSNAEIVAFRRNMGIVFQKHALISNFTIFENIALPLRYHTAMPDSEVRSAVTANLAEFGIAGFATLLPEGLSLGQARLVSIARALIMNPEIIFMDEPLGGLDPVAAQTVTTIILKLIAQKDKTIIIVSNSWHLIQLLDCPVLFLTENGMQRYDGPRMIEKIAPSDFLSFIQGEL